SAVVAKPLHEQATESCSVYLRIRTATTTPDPNVSNATIHTAAATPAASATIPATIAPTAYPRSRHRRYTPIDDARHAGWTTSPMAARSVGYTSAVPMPSRTAPVVNPVNVFEAMTAPMPAA